MSKGETVGFCLLVVLAGLVAYVAIGQRTAPTPTHFTDCRHVLDLVNGHW